MRRRRSKYVRKASTVDRLSGPVLTSTQLLPYAGLRGYRAAVAFEYQGLTCLAGSAYPGDVCDLPGAYCNGTDASNCTWWSRGRYSFVPDDIRRYLSRVWYSWTRVSRAAGGIVGDRCTSTDNAGLFINDSWQPLPSAACVYVQISPIEAIKRLLGKRLVFTGDSMVRQLFTGLVSHIRGFTAQIESVFHEDASYRFSGHADHFQIGHASAGPVAQDEFELMFMWAVDGIPVSRMQAAHPDYVISGVMYWDSTQFEESHAIWQQLSEVLHPERPWRATYWLTTPLENPEQRFNNSVLAARNIRIRHWASAHERLRVVGFDKLAAVSPWQRVDTIHFGCMFNAMFPDSIEQGQYRTPDNKDCRNLMYANLINVILGDIAG